MNEKKKQEIPVPFKLDDFFTTQETRDEEAKEKIENINIDLIDDFENHPFKVIDNDELKKLEESIRLSGILSPCIVRKKENDRYEMISGHRRKFACKKIGLNTIPCVIKDLTLEEATIFMVDSNLQREKLLPSEKAFAYKMKYEALKQQEIKRPLDTSVRPLVTAQRKDDLLGEELGESGRQIQRYIRLTYLIPELLKMVDNNEINESPAIALRPAVELSFLKIDEQRMLEEYIKYNLSTPSLAQAIKLKELSKNGLLKEENIESILEQEKPNQIAKFKINESKLYSVLPKNINREKVEDFVLKACEYYSKHLKQKEQTR